MIALVASAILPIILNVAVGFGLAYRGFLSEIFLASFSKLTFRFFIPCLLFASIYQADVTIASLAQYWSGYFIPVLLIFGVAVVIKSPIFALATTYANTVMVGIPLTIQLWENEGLNIAIVVISLNSMTLFLTYALTASFGGTRDGRIFDAVGATIRNPIILSLVVGVSLNILSVSIFSPLLDSVELAGRAGLPCALLILGATLAGFATYTERENGWWVTVVCLLKLLAIPAAVLVFTTSVLNLSSIVSGVLVLLAACPCGINVLPFAQAHGSDRQMVSASIFISTIASVLTLPIWVTLVT